MTTAYELADDRWLRLFRERFDAALLADDWEAIESLHREIIAKLAAYPVFHANVMHQLIEAAKYVEQVTH